MTEDPKHQELLNQACQFVERMVDKKIASDDESHRENSRNQSRNSLAGILLVAVTLAVGAGGIIANGYAENRDRDHQALVEANARKLEIISAISGAITGIRELRSLAMLYCNENKTNQEIKNLNIERIKRRYELIKSTRPRLHFFNEKFRLLIQDFITWEKSVVNYCDPAAPNEMEWREKQRAIEAQMVLSPAQIFTNN